MKNIETAAKNSKDSVDSSTQSVIGLYEMLAQAQSDSTDGRRCLEDHVSSNLRVFTKFDE